MMGVGHRLVAANVTFVVGAILDKPAGEIALAAALAAVFSAGKFSPDADNREPLRKFFGHRGLLHWWGLPAMALIPLAYVSAPFWAYGPVLGWSSHIFPADFVFGKGGRSIPKGIPLGPGTDSPRLGLGFKVSGSVGDGHSILEYATTVVLGVVLAWQLVAMASALTA